MTILGAREEHELFEYCYRGGKKISARDYTKRAAKLGRKVKFPAQLFPTQIIDWASHLSSKV